MHECHNKWFLELIYSRSKEHALNWPKRVKTPDNDMTVVRTMYFGVSRIEIFSIGILAHTTLFDPDWKFQFSVRGQYC